MNIVAMVLVLVLFCFVLITCEQSLKNGVCFKDSHIFFDLIYCVDITAQLVWLQPGTIICLSSQRQTPCVAMVR